MLLNIPTNLPALGVLRDENINIHSSEDADATGINPLKIVILNLMPVKITTETDLLRLLSNSPLPIEVDFLRIESHISKNTPKEHLDAFYKTFKQIENNKYDGMIITGAPVEQLDFEQVSYWNELTCIMDWTKSHVTSTLFICWAAQAGLYHFYGVPKYPLPAKMFGVFEHVKFNHLHPIFRGFDDIFYVPHSRHTEVRAEDIAKVPALTLLSESAASGVYMVMAANGREFFITGHSEYSPNTLDTEYKRDLSKGLPINLPQNYYLNNNPNNDPLVRWRSHANLLFSNWLHYFVAK